MKLSPSILTVTSVLALSSSLAAEGAPSPAMAPAPAATSPLLGSWSLDTSRLPMPADQRPKDVRFTFTAAGSDKLNVHVDIVYDNNEQIHSVSTASLDGTPAVLEHSPEADTVALKRPSPDVLVMALLQGNVLVSTRIYAVRPDGHTLIETAVYPGNDGPLVMKTNYFTRAR